MRTMLRVATLMLGLAGSLAVVQPHALAEPPGPCETDAPDIIEPEILDWERNEGRFHVVWTADWQVVLDCQNDANDGPYDIVEVVKLDCVAFPNCRGNVKVSVWHPLKAKHELEGPIRGRGTGCSNDGNECRIELESRAICIGGTCSDIMLRTAYDMMVVLDTELLSLEITSRNAVTLNYHGESGGLNE